MKWTPRAKRIAGSIVTAAFFGGVVWLLQRQLRELEWREIAVALRELSPARVAVALLFTGLAYAVVAGYDRLAVRYARAEVPTRLGFAIAFVSYAFNFNLGATVGALGMRYRLYSRAGVPATRIAAIAGFSIVTNWCGCLSVLGAVLIADPSMLQVGWGLSPILGRLVGALALAPVAGYLLMAAVRRAPVRVRGRHYRVPGLRLASFQVALASAYWLIVPLALFALAPTEAQIRYPELVAAYAIAAVGGIVVRVPAGLGVIEAVFLEVFRGEVGAGPILAMLIAWRAVFLLAPLLLAAVVLGVLEYRGRERATPRGRARPTPARSPL